MFILFNKFKPDDTKIDKKLKFEFQELIDNLLRSSAEILTDQFNVKYKDDYGFEGVSLNPTVYEMLKRYEFVKQKDNLGDSRLAFQSENNAV